MRDAVPPCRSSVAWSWSGRWCWWWCSRVSSGLGTCGCAVGTCGCALRCLCLFVPSANREPNFELALRYEQDQLASGMSTCGRRPDSCRSRRRARRCAARGPHAPHRTRRAAPDRMTDRHGGCSDFGLSSHVGTRESQSGRCNVERWGHRSHCTPHTLTLDGMGIPGGWSRTFGWAAYSARRR